MTQNKMTKHDSSDVFSGRHLLVPVATAESAGKYFEMAFTLMKPEEGYVTVLGKPPTGTEDAASNFKRITSIVEAYQNEGYPIRLRTKVTGTFSRSILEAVREWAVDVVLLPVYRSTEFEGPSMGSVIENIVATTPCQVLMYRHALAGQFTQILVPVLHENEVDWARDFSDFLSDRLQKPAETLPYQGRFDQKYEADETLLGIVVSGQSNWQTWQDITAEDQRIFGGRNGLLVLFMPEGKVDLLTSWDKFKNWLNPKIAPYEESELVALQHESGVVSLDYIVLILIAAILATLGLVLNSNAVIIGAMLVAPLMAPLIAFSTGMAIGEIDLVRKAVIALFVGILLALGVSYLGGLISNTTIVTSEMAGRGNPTFLDLAVALASGVIGAYAAGRKSISSAAAGVAIAAALMPPLCTVGLAYAFGDSALSRGAFLLFLTNIISIILAATITFFWLGLRSYETDKRSKRERRRTSNILIILFMVILVALWVRQVQVTNTAVIENILQDSFQQAELVNFDVREEAPLLVTATIRQPIALMGNTNEIIAAKQNLESSLEKEVDLRIVVEPIVDAAVVELRAELESSISEILEQEMPSSNVVDFSFLTGNPSVVIAGVTTEIDENSETFQNEKEDAKNALSELFGVTTELLVIVVGRSASEIESIQSADVFIEETIREALEESMPSSQVERFTYQFGNPTIVHVVVSSDLENDSDVFQGEVRAAEDALKDGLGVPIRLTTERRSE